MLTHLTINNFTLVEHLDLDISSGMTAITGETGTGKSIMLDALSMTLGERADADKVRIGASKADITATFSLDDLPEARAWLIEHDLAHADECLLRRVITSEGRSRSFINAQPVTLQQIRALSELLIDIHSQHAHQSLLSKTTHQRLLDEYGQHTALGNTVAEKFQQWQQLRKEFIQRRDNADEIQARYKLLSYQVEELDQLNLSEGDLPRLEDEQKRLSSADDVLAKSQQLETLCNNDEGGIQAGLRDALRILGELPNKSQALQNTEQLLNNAIIHIEEAHSEVRYQMDTTELNPERLHEVNEQLSSCYDVARKHHIQPEEICQQHQRLSEELNALAGSDEDLSVLGDKTQKAEKAFYKKAAELSKQRKASAKKLTDIVNQQLATLAMNNANFTVAITSDKEQVSSHGIDHIEFLISTNPGQAHKPLGKVASGGELSRISLAIQVATAQTSRVATLVFDEVDVGIGGSTADTVGKLLSQLGERAQVLCVTHLAQVASKAQQHWQVSKKANANSAQTTISPLKKKHKIEEIARMISGSELSEESIAHAELMLSKAAG